MDKLHNQEAPTQGVESSEEFTLNDVRRRVASDIRSAVALLNAIQADPDLLDQLGAFIHGRLVNAENKAQQKLFEQKK